MGKRQTIGDNLMEQLDDSPFDLLSPSKEPVNGKERTVPAMKNVKDMPQKKKKGMPQNKAIDHIDEQSPVSRAKERMTVQISNATIERVKDCVYWNRATVAQFVENALEAALKEAEKENGKPFQKRRSELKPGRPTK